MNTGTSAPGWPRFWAAVLESEFDELPPEMRANTMGAIRRNAAALVSHVQGLMSEAAQDAQAEALVAEPVDLAAIAATTVGDYRGLSGGRTFSVAPASGVPALGSREALDTVVRHLVENAVRHTGDGGSVEVITRVAPAHTVELVVRDDGPGIAPDVELFTAFSKGARSSGHGLGLHVVQTLVEAMGGTVVGHNRGTAPGAEFVVTLRGVSR